MKKALVVILSVMFLLSFSSTAAFANGARYNNAITRIERTNQNIYNRIDKAIRDADNLVSRYKNQLADNLNNINYQCLVSHLDTARNVLDLISDPNRQSEPVVNELAYLNERLGGVQDMLNQRAVIQKGRWGALSQQDAQALADSFEEELDKIITNLIDCTNAMVQRLIEECARMGIEIECEWIEVEIGGRTILVDPCKTRSI